MSTPRLVTLLLLQLLLRVSQTHAQDDACNEYNRCGRFLGFRQYTMCNSRGQQICSGIWRRNFRGYRCGSCATVEPQQSAYTVMPWKPACEESPYDYVATLEFCSEGATTFGYRLPDSNEPCGSLAPLIRVNPGVKYQLRLQNNAYEYTNVHTHGWHVAGDGNGDDVIRTVSPNNCLIYNWTLNEDHSDGTFWYHSHLHTRSRAQVNGGALGMLIVDPVDSLQRPSWMDNELLLLIVTNSGGMTANGKTQEVLPMTANEWYLLRVAVADPEAPVRDLVFDGDCQVRVAAYDGVWRSVVPHPESKLRYTVSGSNRIDFAVSCQTSAGLYWGHTNLEPIAILQATAQFEDSPRLPSLEEWIPDRPDYLQDLTGEDMEDTFSVTLGKSDIDGMPFDPHKALAAMEFDSLQQWNLVNSGEHPFHLHVNHMQIVTPGGCGHIYEEGEWFDSIASASNRECRVRFRLRDFGGRMIFHCHTLKHEDNGAMAWVDVTNGPSLWMGHYDEEECLSECLV